MRALPERNGAREVTEFPSVGGYPWLGSRTQSPSYFSTKSPPRGFCAACYGIDFNCLPNRWTRMTEREKPQTLFPFFLDVHFSCFSSSPAASFSSAFGGAAGPGASSVPPKLPRRRSSPRRRERRVVVRPRLRKDTLRKEVPVSHGPGRRSADTRLTYMSHVETEQGASS